MTIETILIGVNTFKAALGESGEEPSNDNLVVTSTTTETIIRYFEHSFCKINLGKGNVYIEIYIVSENLPV